MLSEEGGRVLGEEGGRVLSEEGGRVLSEEGDRVLSEEGGRVLGRGRRSGAWKALSGHASGRAVVALRRRGGTPARRPRMACGEQ